MVGEQYKIKGIARAETILHKRDLWTFIERNHLDKTDSLSHLVKTVLMWVYQSQVRGEMFTKILDRLLSR